MSSLYRELPIDLLTNIVSYIGIGTYMFINKYISTSPTIIDMKKQYAMTKIQQLVNSDYLKFINCLKNVNFDNIFIKNLFYKNITKDKIPVLWTNNYMCGYYDLKYIFEMMYYLSNSSIHINDHCVEQSNSHLYRYFYQLLKRVISPDRKQTILEINKTPCLFPLHSEFVGYDKILRRPMPVLTDYIN